MRAAGFLGCGFPVSPPHVCRSFLPYLGWSVGVVGCGAVGRAAPISLTPIDSRYHGVPSSHLSSAKVVCGHSIMPPRTCFESRAEVPFIVEHGHAKPPPGGSLFGGADLERRDALLESAK